MIVKELPEIKKSKKLKQNFKSFDEKKENKVKSLRSLNKYPWECTAREFLEDFLELDLDQGELTKISQDAAHCMKIIFGIDPIKVRNRIIYTRKTSCCLYDALNRQMPNWRDLVGKKRF